MNFQEAKEFLSVRGFEDIQKGTEGERLPLDQWPESVVIQTAEAVKKHDISNEVAK